MQKTIELKRKAGELRGEAAEELKTLKSFLIRQANDELEESESRLSGSEINEKMDAIDGKAQEASAMMSMDTLEGILSDPEKMDPVARRMAAGGAPVAGPGARAEGKVFPSVGSFFRQVRGLNGIHSDALDVEPLTKSQKVQLVQSWHAAVSYSKGEPFQKQLLAPTDEDGSKRALSTFEQQEKALVGDNTGSAGRGDYLVPTEHMAELLIAMGEEQVFVNVCRQVPMTRRTLDFPRLAQSTVADTRPMFSFAAITKIGEGVQKAEREPTFEQLVMTAIKYAAYVEASDELLSDSIIGLAPVLVQLLTSAIAYEWDRDGIRGSGTNEPQGFLGHASEWVQNRVAAGTVGLGDVLGLEERFFGGGPNSRYLHHPSVLPKLGSLAASNVIFWNRDVSGKLPGTLLGRPLVRTHKLPVLGTKGDICLVDPAYYLAGNLQGMTVASSTHYQFRNDLTAWRAVFRAAGTPWPAGLFSMESSGAAMTYRVSPFCVLGDAATS